MRKRCFAAALTPILLASAVGLGAARAQTPPPAATPITSCTALTSAGTYTVAHDLQGTATGCIAIAAPNVTLDLGSHTLAGAGQAGGIGVRVYAGAQNATIVNGTISGFGYGIAASAPYTHIAAVTVIDNTTSGILLTNANNSQIDGSYVAFNGVYGISLAQTDGASVSTTRASNNGIYDIWLNGASNNYIAHNQVGPGSSAGIYLGCSPSGALGATNCAANTHNIIDGNGVDAGKGIGIALGVQASNNVIINNTASYGLYSAFDADGSCGSNSWHNNYFSLTNAACIA